jgi:hypothetical protein
MNVYCDVPTFQSMAYGIPIPRLLGLNTRLASAQAAGNTTLNVVSSAGIINPGDMIYILDGPNSEAILTDMTNPAPTTTTIKLANPTAFTHASGISVSSPGRSGQALAALLIRASGMIESFCKQGTLTDRGLFSKQRTETVELDTSLAYIDEFQSVVFRPAWFPVTNVASAQIILPGGGSVPLDTTNMQYDRNQQRVTFPQAQPIQGIQSVPAWTLQGQPIQRGMQGWLTITYTSGVSASAIPAALQEACILFTQEILSWAQNPTGAQQVRRGDASFVQFMRGRDKESTADGAFAKQAKERLMEYKSKYR